MSKSKPKAEAVEVKPAEHCMMQRGEERANIHPDKIANFAADGWVKCP